MNMLKIKALVSLRGAKRRGNPGAAIKISSVAPGLLRSARNDDKLLIIIL
jgi:hypothetical protein